MWVSPEEEDIDLTQYIYESIILSLPYRRVHPDGECDPDMMARFTAAGSQTEPDDTFADDSDAMRQAAADGDETLRTLGTDNLRTLEALKAGMQHGHADKKEKK